MITKIQVNDNKNYNNSKTNDNNREVAENWDTNRGRA